MKILQNKFKILLISYIFLSFNSYAQKTIIKGIIKDAQTKEAVPFVSVFFDGTQLGTVSDINGAYTLQTSANYTKLKFNFVGYNVLYKTIEPGKTQEINVFLEPSKQQLKEVTVSSKRKRDGYRNKDNPAVELIRNVIAHRDENKLGATATTSYQEYEKITFSISNFSDDFKKKNFFKDYQFMFQQQDSNQLGGKNILPIYISEQISDHYLKKNPEENKTIIVAQKNVDFSKYVDNNGVKAGLNRMYQQIDIYQNNINVMTSQFLSPIANAAPTFYRYYITDTLKNESPQLIALNFEARNPNDLLFDGTLYVTLDGRYAIKKAQLALGKHVNINFVRSLNIDLTFEKDSAHHYYLTKSKLDANFGVFKGKGIGLTGQRVVSFKDYKFNQAIPDSIFTGLKTETLADATQKSNDFWAQNRLDSLKKGQAEIYHNVDTLQTIPSFRRKAEIASVIATGYKSYKYFEIGPIENFNSFNNVEGYRLRFGGRTTPNFNKKLYFENYTAYGFKDDQWKYYFSGAYSLNHQSIYKFPQKYIKASFLRDTKIPGLDLLFHQENSFFLSFRRGVNDMLLYNDIYKIEYNDEFENHISYNLSFRKWTQNPDGGLVYQNYENNVLKNINQLSTSELDLKFRYAPHERFYQGKTERVAFFSPYPVYSFNYLQGISGIFNGQYNYQKFNLSIDKAFQLSQLGFTYVTLDGGYINGKAPFPLLTIHQGNQTYAYLYNSYNLMNFMEFVSDHYASLKIDHNFNGFFLNKIPLIKALKLRELVSFKAIYGGLRDENNPNLHPNLIQFPKYESGLSRTYTLNKGPYLEGSIGLGNILKVIRVDVVKRFTYLNNPEVSNLGIRLSINGDF
ncbi:MAG: carboxypeptidase-like regulatory domain-containing protein [Sphingobacteriales bacterium]|nr:carboxypeptidase-like regulatory domain-containing protein [Sphingobacteriales bacterium]